MTDSRNSLPSAWAADRGLAGQCLFIVAPRMLARRARKRLQPVQGPAGVSGQRRRAGLPSCAPPQEGAGASGVRQPTVVAPQAFRGRPCSPAGGRSSRTSPPCWRGQTRPPRGTREARGSSRGDPDSAPDESVDEQPHRVGGVRAPGRDGAAVKDGWGWFLFGWGLFFAVVLLGGLGGCLVGFSPWAARQRNWGAAPVSIRYSGAFGRGAGGSDPRDLQGQ
jgi:hypothetical protein